MSKITFGLPSTWWLKEKYRMATGYYRIEPIDYSKTIFKWSNILTRRRRFPDPNDLKRLSKAMMDFNKEVEKVNY